LAWEDGGSGRYWSITIQSQHHTIRPDHDVLARTGRDFDGGRRTRTVAAWAERRRGACEVWAVGMASRVSVGRVRDPEALVGLML
jgi:hypothetical protein